MKTRALATLALASALSVGVMLPVSAAVTAATTVGVTLIGGALAITAPVAPVGLGTRANAVGGSVLNGALGVVQVTDARSAAAGSGWVASVIATALTPPSGPTIGAAQLGYTAGTITKVGTATYTANDPPDLTGVTPAVTATGITGDNSATWNPTINVTIPGGMAAGTYTGVITHSVI